MRGAPQSGFSILICRISARRSVSIVPEPTAVRIAPASPSRLPAPPRCVDGERHLAGFAFNGEEGLRVQGFLAGPGRVIPAERRRQPHRLGNDATGGGPSDLGSVMIGVIPSSLHHIAPSPSRSRSNPVIGIPYMRTVAHQIIPWPQWIT